MNTIEELLAKNLPRVTPEKLGLKVTAKNPGDPSSVIEAKEIMREVEQYLTMFCDSDTCPLCERSLGIKSGRTPGQIELLIDSPTFVWGIQYGEGNCSNCGYPARAMHEIGKIKITNMILPYHPECLRLPDMPPV